MKKTIAIKFEALPNGQLAVTVTVTKGVLKNEAIAVLDLVKESIIKQKDKT